MHFEFFLHKQNLWRLLDTDKAILGPTKEQNRGNFTKDFTTTAYILESSLNLKKNKDKKEAHVLCTSLRIMIRSTFETFWHGEQKECMAS